MDGPVAFPILADITTEYGLRLADLKQPAETLFADQPFRRFSYLGSVKDQTVFNVNRPWILHTRPRSKVGTEYCRFLVEAE